MSPTPPAHWLFFPPPTFLAAHAPVKVVYTLAIHLFVFHHDKLLLLHDTSTSKWTVPTRQVVAKDFSSREFRGNPNLPCNMVFSTDEASTAHVSLVHLVLRMLRNPIEERTLEGLQFLDLVSGRPRIDVVNQSTLRLCLHLSVARAGLELVPGRGVVINGPSTYKDLRWIELSEVEAVPLAGKAKELVQGAFETLRRIRVSYQKLREGERPEIAERVRDGSLLISTMVRSVVLGGLITHAVVTVGQSAPELGLFLMEVDAEIVEEVAQGPLTTISNPVPLQGGHEGAHKYNVIGTIFGGSIQPRVGWPSLLDLCDGGVRLKVSWIQTSSLTKFGNV